MSASLKATPGQRVSETIFYMNCLGLRLDVWSIKYQKIVKKCPAVFPKVQEDTVKCLVCPIPTDIQFTAIEEKRRELLFDLMQKKLHHIILTIRLSIIKIVGDSFK